MKGLFHRNFFYYIMTPLEQLEKWVKGVNVHNEERDECCPDFACCQPNKHWPLSYRKEFKKVYEEQGPEAIEPMLIAGLNLITAEQPMAVYVSGTPQPSELH